jgi:formate hydrogenlyase subunit 3/multisubunit Na+/H+ antiporter MnhD subunit
MTELLLLAVPGLPLLLAMALVLAPLRRVVHATVWLAPLPALVAALLVLEPQSFAEPWLLLGARIGIDELRRAFLLFASVLWLLAAVSAMRLLQSDEDRTGFFACFLLAMAGNLGLLVAYDVFSFYTLFALMSFASYGLVVHGRNPESYFAGKVYIAFVVLGELALFAGLASAAWSAQSTLLAELRAADLPETVSTLLLIGFAVKLGIVPLHLWLPLAHAAAPVPASAVLSGSMIKAGLFGLVLVLPLGATALPAHGAALAAAGLVSIFLAALIGVTQHNPKAVLAYSSVSQMGLIALALGVVLLAPDTWPLMAPALLVYAAHHAIAKGALFLGTGVFNAEPRPTQRRLVLLGLLIPAAALAALPLTSGHLAKEALKEGLAMAFGPTHWLMLLILAGTTATTVLMARFLVVLARRPAGQPCPDLATPWATAIALCACLPLLWPFELPAAKPLAALALMPTLVPVGFGIVVSLLALAALRLAGLRLEPVRPGEVLALFASDARPASSLPPLPRPAIRWRRHLAMLRRPDALPARAESWAIGGAVAVAVVLVMALLEAPRFDGALRPQMSLPVPDPAIGVDDGSGARPTEHEG